MERKIIGSVVAANGSQITNVKNKNRINFFHQKVYWGGVLSGIVASIIASFIWHFIIYPLLSIK